MFCKNCGTENLDTAKFCVNCGEKLEGNTQGAANSSEQKNRNTKTLAIIGITIPVVLILVGVGLGIVHKINKSQANSAETAVQSEVKSDVDVKADESKASNVTSAQETKVSKDTKDVKDTKDTKSSVKGSGKKDSPDGEKKSAKSSGKYDSYKHTMLLPERNDESDVTAITPSVEDYTIAKNFSNVINYDEFQWRDEEFLDLLKKNGFVVQDGGGREFFEAYEINRYLQRPNFVTVDSMMHTYHLYFAYLLRSVEKNYLIDEFSELTNDMLMLSYKQYKELKGTEWEDAALRNVAFFAVPSVLLDDKAKFPSEVSSIVKSEYKKIMEAGGIANSEVTGDYEDYSQYKPRGYYEGDEDLEKYFRAMMWCGRIQFTQNIEDMDRSALLMTLALNDGCYEKWDSIYAVTTFFAGASDDLGYCEYMPLIEEIYGDVKSVKSLVGDEKKWEEFHKASAKLEPPKINSIVIQDLVEHDNVIPGYRFMGQRFSVDAAIMQDLVYPRVGDFEDDDKRLLPDVLDVTAALGSKTAFEILDDAGATTYKNYTKNLNALRKEYANADETIWSASLYAGWLDTLRPLLEDKGEGYPVFMQSDAWKKKDLETFAGSYTELKHDTILYSKQIMAEMGGGDEPDKDFRGYVEPEPLVYSRFANLSENTAKGLKGYGYLTKEDEENLNKLAELANKLKTISIKELTNVSLEDEEFELIECYGGEIEHFWLDAMRGITGEENPSTEQFPAALVVDIATDPNGYVLEAATGDPASIYVVVPVDGKLRIAEGMVYSFYEFEQPLSDRLTDSEWRKILGVEIEDYNDPFADQQDVEHPDWVEEYRYTYNFDY